MKSILRPEDYSKQPTYEVCVQVRMKISKNSQPFVQEKGQELKIKLHFESLPPNAEKIMADLQGGILDDMTSMVVESFRCIDT
jgi:hypothetical protein